MVAIFTYQLEKADKKFAEAGVQLETLSNYTELIHLAEEQGYITSEGLELLRRFKKTKKLGKINNRTEAFLTLLFFILFSLVGG